MRPTAVACLFEVATSVDDEPDAKPALPLAEVFVPNNVGFWLNENPPPNEEPVT